jgi:phospholipid-binding lipoprotein MlaA
LEIEHASHPFRTLSNNQIGEIRVKKSYVTALYLKLEIDVSARQTNFRALLLTATMLFTLLPVNTTFADEGSDPLISANRAVYGFNKVVDTVIFKPVAKTYQKITPRFVKRGIRNFLSNLDDVQVITNDLLQLNFKQAGSDFGRFTVNSTIGVGGLFNVAGDVFNMKKNDEDFGQTLAHWGVAPGPYVVLPLLGPSTVRESLGLVTSYVLNPMQINGAGTQDKIISVAAVDTRASFLNFDDLAIGDEYLFLRGIYLQRLEFKNSNERMQVSLTDF